MAYTQDVAIIKLNPPKVLKVYPDVLARVFMEFSTPTMSWELMQHSWYCMRGTRDA